MLNLTEIGQSFEKKSTFLKEKLYKAKRKRNDILYKAKEPDKDL